MSQGNPTEQSSSSLSSSSVSSSNNLSQQSSNVAAVPPTPESKTQGSAVSLGDLSPERQALAEALFAAVEKGDAEKVENLIKKGAPLNIKNDRGQTLLSIAAWKGHLKVVHVLLNTLEGHATVNQASQDGSTPLFMAALGGHLVVLERLLATAEGRATVNQADQNGDTPLLIAAWKGHLDIGTALLRHGANFKEAENWLTRESQKEGLSKADAEQYAKALTNLKLINERYQVEKQLTSASVKAETKQEQTTGISVSSSSQTTAGSTALAKPELKTQSGAISLRDLSLERQVLAKELFAAIEKGDAEKIENLIKQGVPLNVKNDRSQTPLLAAARVGCLEMVEHLLAAAEGRATVDQADGDGETPLYTAAKAGHLEVVQCLLAIAEGRATVNRAGWDGETPLGAAAREGYPKVVRALLTTAEGRATVNQAERLHNYTPLCAAARRGHLKVVSILLETAEGRVTVNQAGKAGQTPLMVAAQNGHLDIGYVLLLHGADFKEAEEWLIRKGNREFPGKTMGLYAPVTLKLINERYQAEKLAASTPVKAETKQEQTTGISASSSSQTTIEPKALPKPELKTQSGAISPSDLSPERQALAKELFDAVKKGDAKKVRHLIKQGAPLNAKNNDGETPLSVAAWKGHLAAMNTLLGTQEGRATVSQANQDGDTPLHMAVLGDHPEIVRVLLKTNEGRAAVNQTNRVGHTPLYAAILKDNIIVASVFSETVEGRISAKQKDQYGNSPLSIAKINGHHALADLLEVTALYDPTEQRGTSFKEAEELAAPVSTKAKTKQELGSAVSLSDLSPERRALAEALFVAIKEENTEIVENLIQQDAPLNVKNDEGLTPLLGAVLLGHLEIVIALLTTPEGRATVHQASDNFTLLFGVVLLDHRQLGNRFTLLFGAVLLGHHEIVLALLATAEGRATVNQAEYEISAFLLAILLSTEKWNKEAQNDENPFTVATPEEYFIIALTLIRHGANFKEAEEWIIRESQKTELPTDTELFIKALANLKFVKEYYQAEKRVASAPAKADTKQVSNTDNSAASNLDVSSNNALNSPLSSTHSSSSSSSSLQTTTGLTAPTKPELKAQGSAVNLSDLSSEQRTLAEELFAAVEKGDAENVGNLIKQGAPLNVKNGRGRTPLFVAAWKNHPDVVTALLTTAEGRATANQADRLGHTPLLFAVHYGHPDMVVALLATAEGRAAANQVARLAGTPLWLAASEGRLAAVTALLATAEGRATVNQVNQDGVAPLVAAAKEGHLGIALVLLRHGANFKEAEKWFIREGQEEGLPAAEMALLIKMLVHLQLVNEHHQAEKLAASVPAKTETEQEQLQRLLSDAVKAHASARNLRDLSFLFLSEPRRLAEALFDAVEENNAEAVENLIKQGAPLNVKNDDGETPLYFAVSKDYLAVAERLLATDEGRFTVNQVDQNGVGPLTRAVLEEHLVIALTLLRHGANSKEAEKWLIRKGQKEGLTEEEIERCIKTLANLKLLNEYYQIEKRVASIPAKAETKQEQVTDTRDTTIFAASSSSQTTTDISVSAQTVIEQIQTDLTQGNVETLQEQLSLRTEEPSADTGIQSYLEQQVLTDILYAKADPKAELKDVQQTKLTETMEAILKADPITAIQPNKEDGLTPLDVAVGLALPKDIVTTLQYAEQNAYDQQDEALQQTLTEQAQNPQITSEDKQICANLASQLSDTNTQLKEVRAQLEIAREQIKQLQPPVSVPLVPESTPLVRPVVPLASVPVALSTAQKKQIALGQRLLNIKLTRIFTKGLAIKYKLVDAHNQNRVGTVAEGAIKLVGDLLPVPGAGLAAKALVAGVKMAANKAAHSAMQKRDIKRQDQRLGEIETIDQAAERIAALVKNLTRRFQLIFAQLEPESLEVFVDRVVDRMIHYWDIIPEKLERAKVGRELLYEGLVDCMQPLPKASGKELSEDQQFDHLIENMVLGASLWKDRDAKASSRGAKLAGGKGSVAKIAGFVVGDRPVYYQSMQGPQQAMVQQICCTTSVVTWKKGEKDPLGNPVYRYGYATSNSQPSVDTIPPLYVSEEECTLRRYTIDPSTTASLDLPIRPEEFDPTQVEQLKRQRDAAEARATAEKKRADTAEAKVAELKSTSPQQQGQARAVPVKPPKPPAYPKPKQGSGLFNHKLSPPPVPTPVQQPASGLSNGPTPVISTVTGGGLSNN